MKISYCLFSFNQEPYLREAIRSALAQDYSPLQILIIDDGSSDRSADIIRAETDGYRGPHEIRILLKPENKGFMDSVNEAVYRLADGDWLVFAAGDDISKIDRVSHVAKVATLHSEYSVIQSGLCKFYSDRSEASTIILAQALTLVQSATGGIHGAAASYRRVDQLQFPEIDLSIVNEDLVMTTRALTLGGFGVVDSQDVYWRRHSRNLSSGSTVASLLDRAIFSHGRFLALTNRAIQQQISDVTWAIERNMLLPETAADFFAAARKLYNRNRDKSEYFNSLRNVGAITKLALTRPRNFLRQSAYLVFLLTRMTLEEWRKGRG